MNQVILIDGSVEGIVYTLSLLVSDGIHDVEHTIFIKILNRVPHRSMTLRSRLIHPDSIDTSFCFHRQ